MDVIRSVGTSGGKHFALGSFFVYSLIVDDESNITNTNLPNHRTHTSDTHGGIGITLNVMTMTAV